MTTRRSVAAPRRIRVWSVLGSTALLLGACGGDESVAESAPQRLSGMRGIAPTVDVDPGFVDRLAEADPELAHTDRAALAFDAAIVVGLAAETSQTDGFILADAIAEVTGGGTTCRSFQACKDLIAAGQDVDYDGVSGPLEFSEDGDVTEASFEVLTYGTDCADTNDDRRQAGDPELAECIGSAGEPAVESPRPPGDETVEADGSRLGDGYLVLGSLPPPPDPDGSPPEEVTGIDLAVDEMNEAGGVLSQQVTHEAGAAGADADGVADALSEAGVDAVVDVSPSTATVETIERVVESGVVFFATATTSPKNSPDEEHRGLHFRIAPADRHQGSALGELVVGDGRTDVFLLTRDDEFGEAVADGLVEGIEDGGSRVAGRARYDPDAEEFSGVAGDAADSGADAVVVAGFDESSRVFRDLALAGIELSTVYGLDANMSDEVAAAFESGR